MKGDDERDRTSAAGRRSAKPRGNDGSLRFRILTISGKRKAFSLEVEVWAVLEAMARNAGLRLGAQIETVLGASNLRNASAALRLAALRWQAEALAEGRRSNALLLRQVISAIPAPACALSYGQMILARNRPFRDLQASLTDDPDDSAGTRLILGAPPVRIANILSADSGRAVSVPFVLRSSDGRSLSGQLNVSGMRGDGQETVFLCVVRQPTA